MPAAKLAKLGKELGNCAGTEGVMINVSRDSKLYHEITRMLLNRGLVYCIKTNFSVFQ